jgi:hypothetical protein
MSLPTIKQITSELESDLVPNTNSENMLFYACWAAR